MPEQETLHVAPDEYRAFLDWTHEWHRDQAKRYGPRIAKLTYPQIVDLAESIQLNREELHWADSYPRFKLTPEEYQIAKRLSVKRVLMWTWERQQVLEQVHGELHGAPPVPKLTRDPDQNLDQQLEWLETAEELDKKNNPTRWDRFRNHEHPVWKAIRTFIREKPGKATTDRLKEVEASMRGTDARVHIGSVKDYLSWLTDIRCCKNDTPVRAHNPGDGTGYYASREAWLAFGEGENAYFDWLVNRPLPAGYEE